MGGSMGSVVGEKIARLGQRSLERKYPLIIVSASGGARMQEGVLSLMQMAKAAAMLSQLAERRIPYVSILTNPTTGGVSASYAMLGDAILAEPGAVIGFAGPRVIKQTIGQDLPEGFQTAEFLLDHGMLDRVVHRTRAQADRRPAAAPHERQAGRGGVGDALSDPYGVPRGARLPLRAHHRQDRSSGSSAPRRSSTRSATRTSGSRSFTSPAPTARAASARRSRPLLRAKGLQRREVHVAAPRRLPGAIPRRWRADRRGRTSSISSSGGRRRSSGSARRSSRRPPRWRSTGSRAQGVDVAVIETGLGGRLDSTNVVRPLVAGVTSIGIDHVEYLGETREEIAAREGGDLQAGRAGGDRRADRTRFARSLRSLAREHGASSVIDVATDATPDDVVVNARGHELHA